jgi:leucyl/phenylalanyl-tRNA--protein transferase
LAQDGAPWGKTARLGRNTARLGAQDGALEARLARQPYQPIDWRMSRRTLAVTTELMLRAYRAGLFPMAETRDSDKLYWLDPEQRGVLPLYGFHLPRRLLRTVLSDHFTVSADQDFAATIAACAEARPGREDTWINPQIEQLFTALHRQGHAHSVECRAGGDLVGGLYGVAIGGAFFGESMFSRVRDASKVALAHLVARLRLGGFALLDTQFVTRHLAQFGAHEISRADYKGQLARALLEPAVWLPAPAPEVLRSELRALESGGVLLL